VNCFPGCDNKKIQNGTYPRQSVKQFYDDRGFGVCTDVDIRKGDFVNEYVGEIINETEKLKRSGTTNKIMRLSTGIYIDAGNKGNISRFFNHSCAPNCQTQYWWVNGVDRIGFFALKDIASGTELTFNYEEGSLNMECRCGSGICRPFND
jgi:histone-lysine N-methyltransferase NSD2